MRKELLSLCTLFFFGTLLPAGDYASGVLVPSRSGSLGERQRNLEDHLQQQHRAQQKYQTEIAGAGPKDPAEKLYEETRETQERRMEILRKEQQEGASAQTTLRRTLDDQQQSLRESSSVSPARSGTPGVQSVAVTEKAAGQKRNAPPARHYEREKATHRIMLRGENHWDMNQRAIGRQDLKERLTLLSQDNPPPKLEVTFGSDVSPERREQTLRELKEMGFSEISVCPDVKPKQKTPVLKMDPPPTYHWWQPEWWVRPHDSP